MTLLYNESQVKSIYKEKIILRTFRKNFDFVTVFKYLLILLIFIIFNNLEREVMPYSSAVFTACLVLGSSIFTTAILYIFSFLFLGEVGLLGAAGIFILVISPITYIYRRFKVKSFVEFLLIIAPKFFRQKKNIEKYLHFALFSCGKMFEKFCQKIKFIE